MSEDSGSDAVDERAALDIVADHVEAAGDDCAVVGDLVLTTDMLHASTDFPPGTTRYTAGWRAVGASLSDVASMGAEATAALAVYADAAFHEEHLAAFLEGCRDVCEAVDAAYVGGDLDRHDEFTVATTALGRSDDPVRRSGAAPGEVVCVTGTLGRSAAAVRAFRAGDPDRGNDLFRFEPRVAAGCALRGTATAMMDSSDGLARSLHRIAEASGCGFALDADAVPVDPAVDAVAEDDADRWDLAVHYGEDFELVFTVPEAELPTATDGPPVEVTPIGEVTGAGVTVDGDPLPDRGYTH